MTKESFLKKQKELLKEFNAEIYCNDAGSIIVQFNDNKIENINLGGWIDYKLSDDEYLQKEKQKILNEL